jgi:hypothetical protein
MCVGGKHAMQVCVVTPHLKEREKESERDKAGDVRLTRESISSDVQNFSARHTCAQSQSAAAKDNSIFIFHCTTDFAQVLKNDILTPLKQTGNDT